MKKFLFLILISCMSVCITRASAQSVDSLQVVIDSLSVRVAVLEHDLAYLRIDTEINRLDESIKILSIEMGDLATDFQISSLARRLEDSKDLLQDLYEALEKSVTAIKDRVDLLPKLIDANENILLPVENTYIYTRITGLFASYYNLKNKMSIIREALYE